MRKDKIYWEGREFSIMKNFDCHVVELNNYFTCLPISPLEYREKNPTRAAVKIEKLEHHTKFTIWSDWGEAYEMFIPNEMTEEIEVATKAAIDQKLLKEDYGYVVQGFESFPVKILEVNEKRGMFKISFKHFKREMWVQRSNVILSRYEDKRTAKRKDQEVPTN